MKIEIENTSSPGASFTDNTNEVLLKIYDWIKEHENDVLSFKGFRIALHQEKGINDNNSRNIYPLLKNCGLVQYENRGNLVVKDFFTNTGLAYVKTLETKCLLRDSVQYSESQKLKAIQKLDDITSKIIRDALSQLLKNKELNYIDPLKGFISYILAFEKINKTEFAYYLYAKKVETNENVFKIIEQNVYDYRSGNLQFDIQISVRNDIELRQKTKSDKRKEGLSYLTSYTYFSSLLQQAGLVFKQNGYFVLKEEYRSDVEKLLEV